MSQSFRPEIEGLRALAVLPVLLFHMGLPWMPGGFIGVDVFFVISGFLITGILVRDAELGRLSIAAFYERRIRRIAPALLTVFIASAIASTILLFPGQLIGFAKSLLAAEAFVSNIWFWRTSGYFAAQGGILPLLHTWSLAVEEQFYLFIPLIIALIGRKRQTLSVVLILITAISFVVSVMAVSRMPGAAFYLIPTRAWELLLGSLIALRIVPTPNSRRLRDASAWLGLAMIVGSIILLTEQYPFPGLAAAPATFGAAIFIWAANDKISSGRVMALRPMRFVGSISYSLYLWHWPIIVLMRQYLGEDLSISHAAIALALSFAAAIATWWYIERPTRDRSVWPTKSLLIVTGAAAVVLAAYASAIITLEGLPARFSLATLRLEAGSEDYSPIANRCGMSKASINEDCRLGSGDPTFLLVGDSHAGAVAEAVDVAARKVNQGGLLSAYNACPALVDWRPTRGSRADQEGCIERNRQAFDRLRTDPAITTIIIAGYWPPIARADQHALQDAIDRTAAFVAKTGKRLIIFDNLPEPKFDVPWHLAVSKAREVAGRTAIARPKSPILLPPGTFSVNLADAMCFERECPLQADGRALYVDGNHVSAYANRKLLAPYLTGLDVF